MPNWTKFHYQISKNHLYEDSTIIEGLLQDMATQRIIAVEQHPGGTQLKFIIFFEDGGRALFKPMRYPRDKAVPMRTLYLSDHERHVSEIAAFHLDRILGFRRAPPVVGRRINIASELFPLIKNLDLINTFYITAEGKYCFYGKCRMYCDKRYSFCGNPDIIEGSFAAYLPPAPYELLAQRLVQNPWKRTYIPGLKAEWEKNSNYCNDVVKNLKLFQSTRRLYDVIDCAIFDFLIGNEDRHDYDEFTVFGKDSSPTIIHLDNGRGFARSYHDEKSIIAPLTQCCQIRLSTFNKLYSFLIGPRSLSDLMRGSLYGDPVAPVLTEPHLHALDRRVISLLQIIHRCIENYSSYMVFLNDIPV
nr:extracellular serine/threonine protein kinase FAM20C-like [Parasteatoda tepidariorum]